MDDERLSHRAYTREVGDDAPDVRDWTWPGADRARRGGQLEVGQARADPRRQRRIEQRQALADRRRRRDARRARARGSAGASSTPAAGRGAATASCGGADAVGHRIVHGGERFREPVRIDADVERGLRELVDLAPLHQPKSLAALDAVAAALPGRAGGRLLRHRVPRRRCRRRASRTRCPSAGASGWACAATASTGSRTPGSRAGCRSCWAMPPDGLRIVSCHLGAGASLCAIADGRSVDTTMGFTPLEGLVMATRSGSVDPGLLLWLLEQRRRGGAGARRRARARVRAARARGDRRHARGAARGGRGDERGAASRSTSTCTGCAPGSRRWPPRSAGSTCSSSPAASASTPPRSGRAPRPAWSSSAWRSTTA